MATTNQRSIEIKESRKIEHLASEIANKWEQWKNARQTWEAEKRELRNYLFATDTTKTQNKKLPWKNTTTTPKLTQIRDNLHANYFQAMFPHDDWLMWKAADEESATKDKRRVILAYMKNKLRLSGFYDTISRIIYDYIDYGNCFGEITYINENHVDGEGTPHNIYSGPKLHRVSPFDICFDITANDFEHAPKITRSLISIGTLEQAGLTDSNFEWGIEASTKAKSLRVDMSRYKPEDVNKYSGLEVDGFGSTCNYLDSGLVEVLEFEGSIFDANTQEYLVNQRIIVIDRSYVVHKEPFKSWLGRSSKQHLPWRPRPDNLMGMGPLDNLVGMQYRVDHLENLKADVFDQIAHPIAKERGYVEDWEYGPGEKIHMDVDADVEFLRPDATALNADFQIQNLLNLMEELAGAPRQAMGIRTPGEKTAFEVQSLDNAASRIFQSKIQQFEREFLEPILNMMFEEARRSLDSADIVQTTDNDYGVEEFLAVSADDLKARGNLVPVGARHFARKNQMVQNLVGLVNSAAYQDPMVQAHISSLKLAEILQELMDLDKYGLVRQNIRISEQAELQRTETASQEQQVTELATANAVDQEQLEGAELQ
jgi:hypothetical protein